MHAETLFDPIYAPGYCDDCDLSIRIAESGGTIQEVAVPIRHLHAQSFKDVAEKNRIWGRNRTTLMTRWNLHADPPPAG